MRHVQYALYPNAVAKSSRLQTHLFYGPYGESWAKAVMVTLMVTQNPLALSQVTALFEHLESSPGLGWIIFLYDGNKWRVLKYHQLLIAWICIWIFVKKHLTQGCLFNLSDIQPALNMILKFIISLFLCVIEHPNYWLVVQVSRFHWLPEKNVKPLPQINVFFERSGISSNLQLIATECIAFFLPLHACNGKSL